MHFASQGKLNGILRHLSRQKKLYKGQVTANATSTFHENNWGEPYNVLDFSTKKNIRSTCWCSSNTYNSSIDINFKMHNVFIKAFALRLMDINKNYSITNFTLEGSNSSNEWETLYVHRKEYLIPKSTYYFDVQKQGTFNHFRFKMTNETIEPISNHFIIGNVEFFGIIEDFSPICFTCKYKRSMPKHYLIIMLYSIS